MTYWIDLFTGTTWDEFQQAGANVTGFRHRMRKTVARIKPGDILLCYMTGVMRWVGALEVVGPTEDKSDIWSIAEFPERLAVKPVVMLAPEIGIPMAALEGHVDFFRGAQDRGKFKGFVRRSPYPFQREQDGDYVMNLLRQAKANPTERPVDPAKLARKPLLKAETKKGKKKFQTLVSIPETEDISVDIEDGQAAVESASVHVQIQHTLLQLGSDMGFDIWVARNDRGRACNGTTLGAMAGIVEDLPTQFNEATNRTVELIDVLWLKGNAIIAAFEVECTTSVYSGLLRMSDLVALQPNLNISLYIVAPDERRNKVSQEILRPTFMLRQKPLAEICGFISTSELIEKVQGAQKLGLTSSLKPEFLDQLAEYFTENE